MGSQAFQTWLSTTPILLVGLVLFGAMVLAALLGGVLRTWRTRSSDEADGEGQEGYIVSAVLGLLALLLGFTFALAVDRFETRRQLVLEEANAIGTTYLRAQLLSEPHRARMSEILVRYTKNRIALAQAKPGDMAPLLSANDALVTDMWAATSAAFESIKGTDFSSAYLDSVNAVIDLDASRKTARAARVPSAVFVVLFAYMITSACVLGFVLHGMRGWLAAAFLLALLTLSLLLIVDIDRPTTGRVVEGQGPMRTLLQSLENQPPSVFDRWRSPQDLTAPHPSK